MARGPFSPSGADSFTAAVSALGTTGSISWWVNPAWSSDSNDHFFWTYGSNTDNPAIRKFSDGNIYFGFGTGSNRLNTPATGLFTAGVWANWVMTWAPSVLSLYKASTLIKTGAISSITPDTAITIGQNAFLQTNHNTNGNLADLAVWSVVLSTAEMSALALGARPFMIRPISLINYWPLDGLVSPEPDLGGKGKNATMTGSVPSQPGPPLMPFTPRWPQFSEPPPPFYTIRKQVRLNILQTGP